MLLTTHRPDDVMPRLISLNARLLELGVPARNLYQLTCQHSDSAPIRPTPTGLPHPILGQWDDTGTPAATTDGHVIEITGGPTFSATHTLVAAATHNMVVPFTSDPDGERRARNAIRIPNGLYVCRNDTSEGPGYVVTGAGSLFDRTGIPVEVASACVDGMCDVIGGVGVVRPTRVAVTGLLRATLAFANADETADKIYGDVIDVVSLGVSRPDLIRRCSRYGNVLDEREEFDSALSTRGRFGCRGEFVDVASGEAARVAQRVIEWAVSRHGG